ncbi:hypothetical protein KEM54_006505 [Ascosphaera aggregata]|nr:hypothetical protein KEM54_006505 [Ascosphaera aggregata]
MAGHRKKKGGGGGGGEGRKRKGGGQKSEPPRFVSRAASKSVFKVSEDPHPYWSLSQEARITQRHFSRLNGTQLRHNPVTFVSGGTLAQQNYAKTRLPAAEAPASEALNKIETTRHTEVVKSPVEPTEKGANRQTTRLLTTAKQAFVTDSSSTEGCAIDLPITIGEVKEDLHRVTLDITRKEDSPVSVSTAPAFEAEDVNSSDLSEDEVVFRGRNAPAKVVTTQDAEATMILQPEVSSSSTSIIACPTAPSMTTPQSETAASSTRPPSAAPEESAVITAPAWAFRDDISRNKTLAHRPKRQTDLASESEAESDILRDYIENLDREGMYVSDDKSSDGGNDVNDGDKAEKESLIDHLDEVSTSDEMPIHVAAIHSIRARTSGTQYLVTEHGETINKAKWVSKEYLLSHGAQPLVDQYLREAALSDSDDDDEGDDEDDGDIPDSDEEAAKDRDPDEFIEQLDDEQIARALAKQEELGYLDDDVMIFDGTEDIDFTFKRSGFDTKREAKKKQKKGRTGTFPSASAFVDALEQDPYDAFDVMDFDAPSLRKRNKGKKQIEFDLSDDELAWQMKLSWENDRKKKAAKKREREELRRQGLLGSKTGKPDMSKKYSTGMTIDEVKKELRLFLLSSTETLSLPPMGKKERKIVHEMAHMLNLKSLSRGNGKSRFPTLTKTTKTSRVRASELDSYFASNKVLRRLDWSRPDRHSRAAGGAKAATYEHGEVVGARAPEIGADNRGRVILEKMGWSSGTALGAANNKGILEPVSHVVRKGKAGLG